jgi:hypothetical protein
VTDVHRARRAGILPIPADGSDPEISSVPPAAPVPPVPPADDAAPLPARVRQWRDTLLDPGLRDRLLDLPRGAGLGLAVPPEALAEL